MKIIFMGTPDFAVPCLQALLDSEHEVIAVYTQSDKPKGRGHKVMAPPVKTLALEHSIPIFQPITLKADEVKAEICAMNADFIVVVAYGKILPKEVLESTKYGCINVHGSLLPKYRGAGPIQWAVLNGEKVTGITTMYMAQGVDTGDMLLTAKTEIGANETASELYVRLSAMGAPLLVETLEKIISGEVVRVKQNDADATHAPQLTKEMCELDFNKEAHLVHNQIRGLSTWPCATTVLNGKRLKVYKSEVAIIEMADQTAQVGTIIDNKHFVVSCGSNTAIKLVEVQPEGSKRMRAEDFLRGKPVELGTVLGKRSES